MSGWSKKKRKAFESAFYQYLNYCGVNSKDAGFIILGEHLFDAQTRAVDEILDGLEDGIHIFDILKSRQLGVSTIVRALVIFYLGMHPGLQGAVVFDTDSNKNTARREVETMIRNLPEEIQFPKIKLNNRDGITLANDSVLLFMSAGVKKSKSSGTLGRSVGLSLSHMSELCSYDNDEGLEAFENSLSDVNPDRLYIRESTARGFNRWHEMWSEDRKDPTHVRCIFLGWWSKGTQRVDKRDPDYARYGFQVPTEREIKKIREVKELYGHQITPEQLAWIRRKMDPGATEEGDAAVEYEGSVTRLQEQPWTEEDAFQMTGSVFFPPEKLTEMVAQHVSRKFKTYMFAAGHEFTMCNIYPAPNQRMIELKVWEDPVEDATYVVSADVAFGHSETNDRSAIQVLRCYADGLDQVAEYASPLIGTRQFAWMIASLLGYYAGERAEIYLIIEINGPGEAVWNELQSLKHQLAAGYLSVDADKQGIRKIFTNVRNYLYGRSDSMTPGRSWMWKTTTQLKVAIMERLRDFTANGMLHIRSLDTIEEMRSVAREGDSIAAQGSKKDDRVMSLALGIRCWEERVRRGLSTLKRTRAAEMARQTLTVKDQATMYFTHQLDNFFAVKNRQRTQEMRMIRKATWRRG